MLYAVMNGIPIKQIFKYQINPSTASSGVAMTDTIALTESSNNTVHTIERDINNTAVFPTARFTFSFSFAPAARPIMTVEPIADKWRSFGWKVVEVNGHNMKDVLTALHTAKTMRSPTVILMRTVKGKGVSLMEDAPGWHFRMPNRRELKVFCEELNITEEELEVCKRPI